MQSESQAKAPDLGEYTTVIGGNCAPDGSVVPAAGEKKVCTITNIRQDPLLAKLTMVHWLQPSDDPGRFNLLVGKEIRARDLGAGVTRKVLELEPGQYRVRAEAGSAPGAVPVLSRFGARR